MRHSVFIFCASITIFVAVLFSGAEAVLVAESSSESANIVTYGDALWWALNICSVGDASLSPVTTLGRLVGACLIVVGYACFTINVGIIAAWISHLIHRKTTGGGEVRTQTKATSKTVK